MTTVLEMMYYAEFEVIDGLNQHPLGLNFEQWLNKQSFNNQFCMYCGGEWTDELPCICKEIDQ